MIELAMVLPVFLVFIFGIIELSRVYWVQNALKMACQDGAREAAVCGATADDVLELVKERLGGSLDPERVSIIIKDASVYDTGGPYPHEDLTTDEFLSLPDFTPDNPLADLETGKLLLVRAEVAYEDFTLLPMGTLSRMLSLAAGAPSSGLEGITLDAYAFSRHE